jgi:uncharacterized membrane protein YphA (DoxX/SURF4 family)
MSVYVEILVRAPLADVWAHTQAPELHERWDLRFTRIEYLAHDDPSEPQRFRYTTRLGFGIAIAGDGETLGERELPDGSRASALRFSSSQRRSLIREGSGYWKYIPTPDGVRFLTSYDYDTRYGAAGALVDRLVFRPLIGWATAWSFDRLRLWLEHGIEPEQAIRQAIIDGIARIGLAATFLYHGLVPKLLGPDPGEVALFQASGLPSVVTGPAIAAFGVAELVLALLLLLRWHSRLLPIAVAVFALAAPLFVAVAEPGYLGAVFNPVSLSIGLLSLAAIDVLALAGLPSAGRCRRRPAEGIA